MINGEKLSRGWPNDKWNWPVDGDYETLEWFGPGEKPSLDDIAAIPDAEPMSAAEKLNAFLMANPDVAELIGGESSDR